MNNSGAALKAPIEELEGQMSFLEHMEDLRKRMIWSCIGLAIGLVTSVFLAQPLLDFIFTPINAVLPAGSHFIYTRPGEAFSIYLQVAFISAAILAAPWVMFQVWLFIAPGLYRGEKLYAIPFVLLTSAGCVGGALFNHYLAFPSLMVFFGSFNTSTVTFMPSVEPVFDLYVRMLVGLAIVFQMPTVAFFLARMGLVTAKLLIRKLKYAVLIMFVVAAVVTPSSDPWNQFILAGTMLGLYLICVGIVAIFAKRRERGAAVMLLCASATLWPRSNVLPFRYR